MSTKSTLSVEAAVKLGRDLDRPMMVDWLNRWLRDADTLEVVTSLRMDNRVLTLPVLKHVNREECNA